MFFRLMMIANGLTAAAGALFWSAAVAPAGQAVSLEDQAIGWMLLTLVRGY